MKAELNYSLRLRFFGQYLNSCDCADHGESFRVPWDSRSMSSLLEAEQEQAFLYLRPLSQITDVEAIEVAKMYRPESHWLHEAKYAKSFMVDFGASRNYFDAASRAADYLRSIGIALPFMGHSVESLVSAGWVKLIERTDKPE